MKYRYVNARKTHSFVIDEHRILSLYKYGIKDSFLIICIPSVHKHFDSMEIALFVGRYMICWMLQILYGIVQCINFVNRYAWFKWTFKNLQIKGENKYDMECLFKHELNFFFSIPSTNALIWRVMPNKVVLISLSVLFS